MHYNKIPDEESAPFLPLTFLEETYGLSPLTFENSVSRWGSGQTFQCSTKNNSKFYVIKRSKVKDFPAFLRCATLSLFLKQQGLPGPV